MKVRVRDSAVLVCLSWPCFSSNAESWKTAASPKFRGCMAMAATVLASQGPPAPRGLRSQGLKGKADGDAPRSCSCVRNENCGEGLGQLSALPSRRAGLPPDPTRGLEVEEGGSLVRGLFPLTLDLCVLGSMNVVAHCQYTCEN